MRGSGRYGHLGGRGHPRDQMQQFSGHRMDHKHGNYHGQPHPMASEKEYPYGALKDSMSPHMYNEGQGGHDSRAYNQGQRTDLKTGPEKQGNNDSLSLPRGEAMDVRYQGNQLPDNFESLEKKFMSDITKLFKEQNDAEDAENARHREKINTINVKYEEQLGALRAHYAQRRDEFLQRESQAREKQYQQAMMDSYQGSGIPPNDPHGYAGEPRGNYNANQYDTFRDRARFIGNNARDQGFEQREPYPSGRVYDTGSRYY